jgi:hypothetical protein
MKRLSILFAVVTVTSFAGDYEHFVFKTACEAQAKGQRTGYCLLHKHDMIRKRVPVVLGYNFQPVDDTVPQAMRVESFPHSLEAFLSANAGKKRTPKTALVYICPDCQEAEKKWKQGHPK